MNATYRIAMAAGQDAADKQMRAAGRTEWNADDYELACTVVARLMGAA